MNRLILLTLLVTFLGISETFSQKLNKKRVRRILEQSEIMQEHFVGFMLQEEGGKIIYEQHADRHFVPASNTKLLTLYTALNILGDSVPGIQYHISGDSLIIWGTGDPSFLHPKLDNRKVFEFLSNSPYNLYLADQEPLSFEPSFWRSDLSYLPLYGNIANIKANRLGGFEVIPKPVLQIIKPDSTLNPNRFDIRRSKLGNELIYPIIPIPENFQEFVPYPVDMQITRFLLQDTLKKEVKLIQRPKPKNIQTYFSIPSDSLFRQMMLPSDNFMAEQILLMCAGIISDTLEIRKTIDFGLENYFGHLKNPPVWEDGSGLSRFNLFTPRTVLEVLNMLESKIGNEARLKMLLPAGGVSGTLRTAYKTDQNKPFVWAKTGTLRYMHLQSGWIESRKGKTYRYVFMNNNFVRPTAEVRNEMVRIMTVIHENY